MDMHRVFTVARKASAAALVAAAAAVTEAGPGGITPTEWIVVGVAALVAYVAVYWTANASTPKDAAVEPRATGRHEAP